MIILRATTRTISGDGGYSAAVWLASSLALDYTGAAPPGMASCFSTQPGDLHEDTQHRFDSSALPACFLRMLRRRKPQYWDLEAKRIEVEDSRRCSQEHYRGVFRGCRRHVQRH